MRKTLLLLVFASLGCATQARAGVSVHISVGGYGCGYHGAYSSRGYYWYAPRSYAPIYYSSGYYGYPGAYDDGSSQVVYSPPSTPAPADTGAPPVAPVPAAAPASAPTSQAAPQKAPNPIPYGFNIGTKLVQSPWSGFVINGANKAPDQVVYDANTGQAFRIPSF